MLRSFLDIFILRLSRTDDSWDKTLNKLIDTEAIDSVSEHTVTFCNGAEVWICNRWYGYGSPWRPVKISLLPSMRTARKLHKAVTKKIAGIMLEEKNESQ